MVRVLSFCSYRTGVAGDKLRAANIINKYIRATRAENVINMKI